MQREEGGRASELYRLINTGRRAGSYGTYADRAIPSGISSGDRLSERSGKLGKTNGCTQRFFRDHAQTETERGLFTNNTLQAFHSGLAKSLQGRALLGADSVVSDLNVMLLSVALA